MGGSGGSADEEANEEDGGGGGSEGSGERPPFSAAEAEAEADASSADGDEKMETESCERPLATSHQNCSRKCAQFSYCSESKAKRTLRARRLWGRRRRKTRGKIKINT